MGRKMTDEFINYWKKVVENLASAEYEFAKKMRAMPELVILLAVCASLGLLAVLVRLLQLTGPSSQKVPNLSAIA